VLRSNGLNPGLHTLAFTAGSDPVAHTVAFRTA
jgi:hypothetical protein